MFPAARMIVAIIASAGALADFYFLVGGGLPWFFLSIFAVFLDGVLDHGPPLTNCTNPFYWFGVLALIVGSVTAVLLAVIA